MKKGKKTLLSVTGNDRQSHWQMWLQQILSLKEYDVFYHYSHTRNVEDTSLTVGISKIACIRYVKSSLNKIGYYFRVYRSVERSAKIHLLTKQQFLEAPLSDIGLSTRTYHLLHGEDLHNITHVLNVGTRDLKRIRGFGDKALIELKSVLKYKGCLDLLRS